MLLAGAAPAFPSLDRPHFLPEETSLHAGDSAPEQTAAEWLTSHSNALNCDAGCHAMAGTELPGDVVLWGENHLQPTAADCCAACRSENSKRCNTWVWCADAAACGARHHQCWLKTRERPWEDADVLAGGSTAWASGVTVDKPASPAVAAGAGAAYDLALLTPDGLVRLKLRPEAASACKYVKALLAAQAAAGAPPPIQSELRNGLRFYRAEPVPARWGSPDWPDNYNGGRWGPPYSLLQGSLRPLGRAPPPAQADRVQAARPVIRRGMVAWAGGGGGPDFFIALAKHPEWGNGHTVWAEVVGDDMAVVDAIMRRPLRVANWGSINATELVTPLPFALRDGSAVVES